MLSSIPLSSAMTEKRLSPLPSPLSCEACFPGSCQGGSDQLLMSWPREGSHGQGRLIQTRHRGRIGGSGPNLCPLFAWLLDAVMSSGGFCLGGDYMRGSSVCALGSGWPRQIAEVPSVGDPSHGPPMTACVFYTVIVFPK